jgi:hypothetical protein
MIYVIIYVILGILSYSGFKKLIKGNQFEYIFYSVFWPAVWMAIGVGALKDSITGKE